MRKFDPVDISNKLSDLLSLNRRFPKVFDEEQYESILQELEDTEGILRKKLYAEYMEAIAMTKSISSSLSTLDRARRDEQDVTELLDSVNKEYKELAGAQARLITMTANLSSGQELLGLVKSTKLESIRNILEGKTDKINEYSQDLIGVPFAQLVTQLKPRMDIDRLIEGIQTAKEQRSAEIEEKNAKEEQPAGK